MLGETSFTSIVEALTPLIMVAAIGATLAILFPRLRPLIIAFAIVFTAPLIYILLSLLPIDPLVRIALQLIAFIIFFFLGLYITLREYYKRIRASRERQETYLPIQT
jgi:positive regulator of sigma E activity